MSKVDITNYTKGTYPNVSFDVLKNTILGKNYELSLVFVGRRRSRKLNFKHRGKDKSTNILSFPLSKTEGEIFIDLSKCKTQYKNFNKTYRNFIGFLVIHGLLHLKGYEHGSTMERKEAQYCAKFGF